MISLDLGLWKSGAKIVYDTDAAAFFSAASITDMTQKAAVNQLVLDLKSYSLWSKMVALYPFVGGSASTHKFNLKDPQDANGSYRLTFNGGWTHSSNGAAPNGTNGYADTFLTPSVALSLNSGHASYYIRTDHTATKCVLFCQKTTGGYFGIFPDTGRLYPSINDANSVSITPSATKGMFSSSRTASTQILYGVNATTGSATLASSTAADVVAPLGCYRYGATLGGYATSQLAFASLGLGLTTAELGNLNTAVVAFQTTLGRNV